MIDQDPKECWDCKKEFIPEFYEQRACLDCRNKKRVQDRIPKLYQEAFVSKLSPQFKSLDLTKSLFIVGPVGCGKTFAAWAIARSMLDAGNLSWEFVRYDTLLRTLRNSFNKYQESEGDLVNKYAHTSTLFLDDLGGLRTSAASDYSVSAVYEILDERKNCMNQTIITSNKGLEEIARDFDDRIASRIMEICEVVKMNGEDRRLKKGV